jgi:hypothetical protein
MKIHLEMRRPHSCSRRVPVRSGRRFRIDSHPENALVTLDLARELERVLDRFAAEIENSVRDPISIYFKPGIFGHHKVGRAVDIYGCGGRGLDSWKRLWDETMHRCSCTRSFDERRALLHHARRSNLGWRLYKTLQSCGRWSQPQGYPIQLFGPWTRSEGPWKHISDFLLKAHRDHIHVAK